MTSSNALKCVVSNYETMTDEVAEEKGIKILTMATGQGLIIKTGGTVEK